MTEDLPITVKLTRPVTVGETTYSELSFDEPDLDAQIAYAELQATLPGDPKKATEADGGRVLRFWISHLADVPMAVAGKLKAADIVAVEPVMNKILNVETAEGSGDASGKSTQAK